MSNTSLQALLDCAKVFMENWTTVAEPNGSDQDLDKQFLQVGEKQNVGILHPPRPVFTH